MLFSRFASPCGSGLELKLKGLFDSEESWDNFESIQNTFTFNTSPISGTDPQHKVTPASDLKVTPASGLKVTPASDLCSSIEIQDE